MYADDTQLYISMKPEDRPQTMEKLESCLHDICCWMRNNQLVLNDSKTELLHVSSPLKRVQELPPIHIGNALISSSPTVRDLGVVLDKHLSLRHQVNMICRHASLALHRIGKIRHLLDKHTTEILVHSFVSSVLDNCNCLLINIPNKDVAKLQRIQNSAARLVSRLSKREHITPILKELHWLPVTHRIKYKVILMTFKAIYETCPDYTCDLITPYIPSRSLRSSSQNLLSTKNTRTKTFGARMFSCAAPLLWNALPSKLRSQENTDLFKSQLKTYLFNNAY